MSLKARLGPAFASRLSRPGDHRRSPHARL